MPNRDDCTPSTSQEVSLCDQCRDRLGSSGGLAVSSAASPQDCWLCHGLLTEIPTFATLVATALQGYEFATFLLGSKVDADISHREEVLWERLGQQGEPLKMQINREVGKLLEARLRKTVDFSAPDIVALIDTSFDTVTLQVGSLYIYGRYRKLLRGIPQTKWPCRTCRGRGCRACQFTGKMYQTSVEEIIAAPFLTATNGSGQSFHGCGREDIDARMLGTGRPFVLEVKHPRTRTLDLPTLQDSVNAAAPQAVQVSGLRITTKADVERLKNAEFRKVYQVLIETNHPINKERFISTVQELRGATIQQFTPTRVAHRRAQKTRARTIYTCVVESVEDTRAHLTIETESGTYIKEFVSGDGGKTVPSLSALLGTPCIVKELDVVEVKGE